MPNGTQMEWELFFSTTVYNYSTSTFVCLLNFDLKIYFQLYLLSIVAKASLLPQQTELQHVDDQTKVAGPLYASHHPTQKSVRISTQRKQCDIQQPGGSQSQVSQSLQNQAVNFQQDNYQGVQLQEKSVTAHQSMLVI